jgi:DNA anti-recombination protein RmuC
MPINVLVIGAVTVIFAFLIVGEVAWVLRGREFSALCRQIDGLNQKLADTELRLIAQEERANIAEAGLSAANARLEGLRTQAMADTDIAEKFGTVADEVLKENSKAFLDLAGQSFETQRRAMGSEIAGLLMPISASVAKTESALKALENTRLDRQEKWAEIGTIGQELHAQLQAVGDHVNGLGAHLEHLVREFNGMIGSLEGSVMPQARKLNEHTMQDTPEFPKLKPVDTVVRFPRPDGQQEIVAAD